MYKKTSATLLYFIHILVANGQYVNYTTLIPRVIDTFSVHVPHNIINAAQPINDSNKLIIKILPIALAVMDNSNTSTQLGIGLSASYKPNKKLSTIINYQREWINGTTLMDSTLAQKYSLGSLGKAYYTKYNALRTATYLDFNVRYNPNKYIMLNAGRNRFFIGHGYRSLLLSDNAAPIYNLGFTAKFKQLHYATNYAHAWDMNDSNSLDVKNKNKFMTFHTITYTPNKWFSMQLYETVVFATRSNNLYKFKYDLTYLNPIVFLRPVEYSQGSTDNELLGLNMKLKLHKNITLYSQFVLDEFLLGYFIKRTGWWGNKYGIQAGAKYNYTKNQKQLVALAEFNYVRPYTYSHAEPLINYGHLNQALAHPAGANFTEMLALVSYTNNNFMLTSKGTYYVTGLDVNGNNYGANIYNSYRTRIKEFGVAQYQGQLYKRITANIQASYLFKKYNNTNVCAGTTVTINNLNTTNVMFYLGIQSTLFNHYNDY
jgi:hypothetical protein